MKNFYFLSILFLFLSCSQSSNNETVNSVSLDKYGNSITQIKFDYYEVNSGEIVEGTQVEYEFPFTN
jgi:hypothetical protein